LRPRPLKKPASVGRYYDPRTGQFLTVDPLVDTTGLAYSYGSDDPVLTADPSGLCAAVIDSTLDDPGDGDGPPVSPGQGGGGGADAWARPSSQGEQQLDVAKAAEDQVEKILGELRAGRTPPNVEVDTGAELRQVYADLTQGGKAIPAGESSYPGQMVRLADGTRVGWRASSSSGGPTIDVFKVDGEHVKVHLP
jgi:uncharacterized protein RhaS with RHS repeats